MFKIIFSLNDISGEISGFDLGNIKIISDNTTISSSGRNPDQSMMVFITIIEILDSFRKFIKDNSIRECRIVCSDSSFTLLFIRKKGKLSLKVGKEEINNLEEDVVAKEIYNSCNNLYFEYKLKLLDDPVIDDIELALNEYKKILC